MSRSRSSFLLLAAGLLILLVALFFLTHRSARTPVEGPGDAGPGTDPRTMPASHSGDDIAPETGLDQSAAIAALTEKLVERLVSPSVRAHEAVLIFKTDDGYRRFLARAAQAGVIVAGQIDALRVVRVRVRAYDTFAAELVARAADYGGISANTFVEMPPPPDTRASGRQVAVGDTLLATLGVPDGTDTSGWGRGVTIAVLDGGALPDPTLGARLRYLDIGLGYAGTGEAGLHGTAVAAIAAGSAADAAGVAPAASVLSIRVIDTDGKSDVFTVTQAIVAAVDSGAQVINLSLGGYSTSEALNRAIDYAGSHGTVIVAAAGNDRASRLTWPAADPRVISVGATDAAGIQASFSNSGAQLHLTAPGVGIRTAALAGERALFSGTSASAPVVSGAIAALLSLSPGLAPAQAAEILQTHAADGGAAGPDPHYGHGTVDLGWTLSRGDPGRIDTSVSGHHYNPDEGALEIVLQNRSALPASGLVLAIDLNGSRSTLAIPLIEPGRSLAVALPLDAGTAAEPIRLVTTLNNPAGVVDAVPANNTRASLIDLAGR